MVKVDESVDMVIMRCINAEMGKNKVVGDIGILAGHMPLVAVMGISPMRILNDNSERIIAIHGGVVEVRDNTVTIMTEMAEWPEELELERAKSARSRAEAATSQSELRNRAAEIALRRALVRIEVSTYPLVNRKTS